MEKQDNIKFSSMEELTRAFSSQKIDFTQFDSFELEDALFNVAGDQHTYSFQKCILHGKSPQLIYTSNDVNVVFIWSNKDGALIPNKVLYMGSDHATYKKPKEENEEQKNGKSLADTTEITFHAPFYGKTAQGKIDTGADMSSIHATDIKVNSETKQVSFVSDILSDQKITMNYDQKQPIASADGGIQYRAVITLDITINGKKMSGVMFNLNDRSGMNHKILIGQNILEKGKFLVDPANNKLLNKNQVETS